MMPCVVAGVGLLSAALANGIGSQMQKPLALVDVAGVTLAPVLILDILPPLIDMFCKLRAVDEVEELRLEPAE